MSLMKRLVIGTFFILIPVFMSFFWLNLKVTHTFVEQQLKSHSQATVSSLQTVINHHIDNNSDLSVIELLVRDIFDNGHYAEIALVDEHEDIRLVLQNEKLDTYVPAWFIDLFLFEPSVSETTIQRGANPSLTLRVRSNLDIGYEKIYHAALSFTLILIITMVLTVLLLWAILKKVVNQPLQDILDNINAISREQFDVIERTPNTPEFANVSNAINTMSQTLAKLFAQITKQSEQYKRFAYADDLTQLGNRRAFDLALNKLIEDEQAQTRGFLLVIRANSLAAINQKQGLTYGNDYLLKICDAVKNAQSTLALHSTLFRMSGPEFALIIEEADGVLASELANQIISLTKRVEKNEHLDGTAFIGGTPFYAGDTLSKLVSDADNALAMAVESPSRWAFSTEKTVNLSAGEWRDKLTELLVNKTAEFAVQPIVNTQSEQTMYCEWYARLPDKSRSFNMPMNQVIPASIKLDFAIQIDQMIISKLIEAAKYSEHHIGINVSRLSLLDSAFRDWLFDILKNNVALAEKLVIEIPERSMIQDLNYIKLLCNELRLLGVRVCVEHFGAQLIGITHLRQFKPDFIKLDGQFTRNIDTQKDNQLFVSSMISIAESLSIQMIAEMVETQNELDWLKQAGIQLMQGYYIQPPR